MRLRVQILLLAAAMALSALMTAPSNAHPPDNGQIVFGLFDASVEDFRVYTVNPDGSHPERVLALPQQCPHWSPDGTRIATCGRPGAVALIIDPDTGAFREVPARRPALNITCPVWAPGGRRLACGNFENAADPRRNGLYTLRASDGGGLHRLTANPGGLDETGSYSPNGDRLVFGRLREEDLRSLWIVGTGAQGSRPHRLAAAGRLVSSNGDWSPDGEWIVFSRHRTARVHSSLWLIRPDGTDLHRIRIQGRRTCGGALADPNEPGCTAPVWSPDGKKIAFVRDVRHHSDIYTVGIDGTGLTRVTKGPDDAEFADWGTHPLSR